MAQLSFDISDDLLEALRNEAFKTGFDCSDLVVCYIKNGLKGCDNMVSVTLNENVLEKVNIKCQLSHKTPDEVVNDVLWENLEKLEDIPDEFDGEKIWSMLDHDKPEGDDILDRITDMFD